MNDMSKLSLAIFGAAVVLVVGYVGYAEFARERDIDAAQQVLAQMASTQHQVVQQLAASQAQDAWQQSQSQQARVAAAQWQQARRRLASDQECVGGAVVQVRGSTYTQLGSLSQPVHCSGGYADQPLR